MKRLTFTSLLITFLPGFALAVELPGNIAEGTVYREKASVEIVNIFSFRNKPKPGTTVTIVPFTIKAAPLSAKITRVAKGAQCTATDKLWYEIYLNPITSGSIVSARPELGRNTTYPFDVAVLHPQNPMARYLAHNQYQPKDLPAAISMNVVKGALDLNKDGRPDIVFAGFCCDNRNKSHAQGCDYMCSETWVLKNGKWVIYDKSQPC